jgi:hypothetical protein
MFRPGPSNVEPCQQHDPFRSLPPIGEALYLNTLTLPTPDKNNNNPIPFVARKPETRSQRIACKHLQRKLRFAMIMSKRPPPGATSPQCARFRI